MKTFSNCACLHESHTTAKSGLCNHSVGFSLRFVVLVLVFCFIFCVFMGKVLQIQIVFSQIQDERLHSFGLGIQVSFKLSCCAGLPLYLEKPVVWKFRKKNLEFEKFWKKPGKTLNLNRKSESFHNFNIFSSKILIWHKKSII